MAKRRMFSLDIIDTDLFMDMPQTSRLLYYELCMRADDDGFVSSPKKIQKMVGCSEDDFKVLITKQFLIPFDTGVVVIKHWKIHNYLRSDRYKETLYKEEKSLLTTDSSLVYQMDTNGIPNGYPGKDRLELGKLSIYEVVEEEFCRTLSPTEYEAISRWEDNDLTRYAIKQAVLNNAPRIKYIEAILNSYKNKNIRTVQEAQLEEEKFKKNKLKKDSTLPEWFNEEIKEEKITKQEQIELDEMLKEFL